MSTRNITLSLPVELVRRAKVIAAMRDTSVSALVADYLTSLAQADDYERVWRDEQQLMAQGLPMRIGDIAWSRSDVHER